MEGPLLEEEWVFNISMCKYIHLRLKNYTYHLFYSVPATLCRCWKLFKCIPVDLVHCCVFCFCWHVCLLALKWCSVRFREAYILSYLLNHKHSLTAPSLGWSWCSFCSFLMSWCPLLSESFQFIKKIPKLPNFKENGVRILFIRNYLIHSKIYIATPLEQLFKLQGIGIIFATKSSITH